MIFRSIHSAVIFKCTDRKMSKKKKNIVDNIAVGSFDSLWLTSAAERISSVQGNLGLLMTFLKMINNRNYSQFYISTFTVIITKRNVFRKSLCP